MAVARDADRETVIDRLDRVTDPELDESIVELDYISDLSVDESTVTVELVLPTAWCSPAFAWMMATDARDEIEGLAGVEACEVRLTEHMHETEINDGVNERRRFEDAFPDAEDSIEAVRRTLDEKARMGRQYRAVKALLDAGLEPEQIATLPRTAIDLDDESVSHDTQALVSLANGAFVVPVPAEPMVEYLRKATAVGLVTESDDRLFATADGDPIPPDEFEHVQRRARLVATNVSGQGSICEGLNEARNN